MKKAISISLTVCIAATLFACAGSAASENSGVGEISASSEGSAESSSSEDRNFEPQFGQSVTCTDLPFGDEKPSSLDISVKDARIDEDIHSLAAENYIDDITNQISDWDHLPASLLSLDDSAEISLLCVTQNFTNSTDRTIDFYVNTNRVVALDQGTGEEISEGGEFYAYPIYIDADGKNDLTEVADGVRQQMFKITLDAGDSVNVTVGYAVSQSLLEHPLVYVINPFGREDSAAGRLVLGYVE